jgi:DnaJ homolog subfamily C member 3
VDPTLYYKRATAYFSLGRHANALADFDQVLTLTSDTFDKAHLMKAKIHAKEGRWADAREALKHYQAKNDPIARELLLDVSDGEAAARKAVQAQKAKLWTACEESATQGLRVASHSVALRQQRANCALAAGDFEEAVGDLRFTFVIFYLERVLIVSQPPHPDHLSVNGRIYEHFPYIVFLYGFFCIKHCDGEP